MSANIWVPTSTIRKGLDSPELVNCKVKRAVEDEQARKEDEETEPTQKAEEEEKKKERLRVKDEEERRLEAEAEKAHIAEAGEVPEPQFNSDSGKKLEMHTFAVSPPTEISRRRPGPLDIASAEGDVSAPPPSVLLTARVIENLSEVAYPEGIKRPSVELNANVRDGRFRYDRDFLLQFMHICKPKPPTLAALGVLGIEPRPSIDMARGGSSQASIGPGIGSFQKESVPNGFQMGNFQSPGRKLTSEQRFALLSNVRSDPTSDATALQFRSLIGSAPSQGGPGHPMHGKRTRTKRGEKRCDASKATMSQQGQGFDIGLSGVAPVLGADFKPVPTLEFSANRWVPANTTRKAQPDVDSPELVDRKVRALLNKLTMEKFESISDQIIHWANKSVIEKDGRTLLQVSRLVFEHATDEPAWSEMYARLCRKMMEQISPEVQDDSDGKPIAGGLLFRKHLLSRCQEDFERGWVAEEAAAAGASEYQAPKATNKKGTLDAEFNFDEYYAAQKAKRQGLGLIKFTGELFKLQMVTERIMHNIVRKLLASFEDPEEGEIESLCQLLKIVGQLMDKPKARAHMDVYFTRMEVLGKSLDVNSRMQFMLQDVIELRDRKWVTRNAIAAPTTIAAVREATRRSLAFSRAVPSVPSQSRQGAEPGGPGGPPMPASPRMVSHQHQGPPGGVTQQLPMQPMPWAPYYSYGQQPPSRTYYVMPPQHMHRQPHQQLVPHAAPPHQPGPLPMSPRPAAPQLSGIPTMAHAAPHPPHTPQPAPSVSSPPPTPTPSTANAPRLNKNARDFIPGGRSTAKVTIKSTDGREVTLDALKKNMRVSREEARRGHGIERVS